MNMGQFRKGVYFVDIRSDSFDRVEKVIKYYRDGNIVSRIRV